MQFNYKQDFLLWQQLLYRDPETRELKDYGFPEYDFKCFYWTTSRANPYTASCKYVDGEPVCTNCINKDGKLIVIFDHHHLQPGELKGEIIIDFPNDIYPDGFQNSPMALKTDTRLVHGPSVTPTIAEAMAIMPYIKGKDGKDGKDFSYDDLTDEQKEELAKRVAENIETEIPDLSGNLEDFSDEDWDQIFSPTNYIRKTLRNT